MLSSYQLLVAVTKSMMMMVLVIVLVVVMVILTVAVPVMATVTVVVVMPVMATVMVVVMMKSVRGPCSSLHGCPPERRRNLHKRDSLCWFHSQEACCILDICLQITRTWGRAERHGNLEE